MSEDQQLQIAKLIDKEVEQKRRAAWSGFGVELYHGEIALQLRSQQIKAKLIDPKTNDQIQIAEQILSEVKKLQNDLIEDRKNKYTIRFDAIIKRLMAPEKDVQQAIELNITKIIEAKQRQRDELKTNENKEKELKQILEQVRTYVADMHAAYLFAQLKLLTDAYKYALENNISINELPDYLIKVKSRLTIANRTTPLPKIQAKYNDQTIVDEEIIKHFNPWKPQQYIDGFDIDVTHKFLDWDLALKNKEQAAVLNTNEYTTTTEAIADEKQKEIVTAKLESIAIPIVENTEIKSLKEKYQLVEPETMDQADIIINAYIVNKKQCRERMRKISPVNFGIKQMITALESIKNDDNAFEFTGLNFKIIEKL